MLNNQIDRLALAATFFAILAAGLLRPFENWDLIGYTAALLHLSGVASSDLTRQTYEIIQSYVSPADFVVLTSADDFRRIVFEDPRALPQHTPLYLIRPAYLGMIKLVSLLGASIPQSAHFVSAFFAAATVIPAAAILSASGLRSSWVIALPLVTYMVPVAQLATPDSTACAFALWGLFLAMSRSPGALIVALLLPLVRTDFVVISILLAASHARISLGLITAMASIACMLIVNRVAGNYGWLAIFSHTLIETTPYPAEIEPSLHIRQYAAAYWRAVRHMSQSPDFIIYVLAVAACAIRGTRNILFIVPIGFLIIRLALFPAYMDRFFVFATIALTIFILASFSEQKQMKNGQRPTRQK